MSNILTLRLPLFFLLGLLLLPAVVRGQATITIINNNYPGEGFNDPTPAAPIGGNAGTTIGQQRMIAFQHAASIWSSNLGTNVPIVITAEFSPLTCTPTSAILGSARASTIAANFPANGNYPGAEFANTWYTGALANKRSGFRIYGPGDDISATFNSNLGTDANCLAGIGWYYGLDGNHGTKLDLVATALHEFAHGLGFTQFASVSTGEQIFDYTDIYGRRLFDRTTGKTWNQMTDAERVASAKNFRKVVWSGPNAIAAVPSVLTLGTPLVSVSAPAVIVGNYPVSTATFGPALSSPGVTANVVRAIDLSNSSGTSTFDGCTALTNAAAIAGKIAMIDRGTCSFNIKTKNAQNAGAVAVIIANNVTGSSPPALAGTDATIVIPSVSVNLADGNLIKAQLGVGVTATVGINPGIRAGADDLNRPMLFSPDPVQQGSSIAHWDTSAFKNLLMEPNVSADLTHSVNPPEDLSLALLRDLGWFPDADGDGIPDENDTCNLSITTVLPSSLPFKPYAQQLNVVPAGNYTFSLYLGNLPPGMSLSPTGLLSGHTPTPGDYSFIVKMQQAGGCSSTRAVTITVNCADIQVGPASLPGGQKGTYYYQQFTATPAGNYTYYTFPESLPPGLTLSEAGVLSGTPTENGIFYVYVFPGDASQCTGFREYTIEIAPGACPTITLAALPNGKKGTAYVAYVTASPSGSYSLSMSAGSLPPGLTFYPANGLIFGYPNTTGTFTFTLNATNVNECVGSRNYAVTIAP